jgi:hypothetical protein
MVLAMGVVPGVMYQVSVVPGWGSWYLLGVVPGVMVAGECGTWLRVMVLAMGVVPGVMH